MEQFDELKDNLVERMEQLGLYAESVQIGTTSELDEDVEDFDPRSAIESGEAEFLVIGLFRLNELAWSERVLEPEKFSLDSQFRMAAPSNKEMLEQNLRESDLLDLDFNFDEDDGEENE